ncbi:MAG: tetratricopeptide repeat protein [Candidatus Aminicenantes bacterium]|nr:tetratricopeptide repeat protein [Candidatus Aminicenantes bacterium]
MQEVTKMKKKSMIRNAMVVLVGIWISVSAFSQTTEDPGVMLRSAIQKEEVEGDLQGAIIIYQQIVSKYSSNKAVAAKAQLRIGMCYQKLGKANLKQAQDAFQKVLDNYPEQSTEVKEAREKLAALQKTVAPTPVDEEGIRIRKLWMTGYGGDWSTPSPDGRYVSFHHWATGDFAVREVATGKVRRFNLKESYRKSPEVAEASCWSPDGKQIAFCWGAKLGYELHLIDFDGSNRRTLLSGFRYVEPFSWSSDGTYILTVLRKDVKSEGQVALVKVSDGSIRELSLPDRIKGIQFLRGSEIAIVSALQDDNSKKKDLFLYSFEEEKMTPFIQNPANDRLVGVLPGGDWVFFLSDRSGTEDLWGVKVKEDQIQKGPVLIKKEVGNRRGFGITSAGQWFFSIDVSLRDVYIAKLDLERNIVIEEPKKATDHFTGTNISPAWSPDGKYLAFKSSRRPTPHPRNALCILSVDSGELKEHLPDLLAFTTLPVMHWRPDSNAIIYNAADKPYSIGFFTNDIKSGEFIRKSYFEKPHKIWGSAISPDGRYVYWTNFGHPNLIGKLNEFDLETRNEKILFKGVQMYSLALSPDGKLLAVVTMDPAEKAVAIKVAPIKGFSKETMRTLVASSKFWVRSLAWAPDGQTIVYASPEKPVEKEEDERYVTLFQVPVAGGTPQKIGISMEGINDLTIHPDGQRIAFSAGKKGREIWVMENIIPKEK